MRIEGSRIVLRPYTLADAALTVLWKNDPETTRWMGPKFGQPVTIDDARQSLQRALDTPADQACFFAIADLPTDRYLGGIDLTDLDLAAGTAVLSMVIGQACDRGKGYGSEAIGLLLGFAFDTLGLRQISLRVYEKNIPALACYLKNGFHAEGLNLADLASSRRDSGPRRTRSTAAGVVPSRPSQTADLLRLELDRLRFARHRIDLFSASSASPR